MLGLAFVWIGVARAELLAVVHGGDLASNSEEDLYLLLAAFWMDALTRLFTVSRPARDEVPRRSHNEAAVYIDVSLVAAERFSDKTFDKLVESMTLFPFFSVSAFASPPKDRSC